MQFAYASAEIKPVVESMMFEYEPVYNLLAKYEYVVLPAREPADITVPVALTRDGVDVVLARTARLFVERFVVVLFLDTTLREAVFVPRFDATPREETVLFAVVVVARFVVLLDVVERVAFAEVARDAVVRATLARLLAVARGDVRPVFCIAAPVSTIGSANTERIETNVEQTKNAAANKNTVPIAFLQELAFIRNVMKISYVLSHTKSPQIWAIRA